MWGDIAVTLNGTKFDITNYTDEGHTDVVKSGRVFGCNNLLGSPQGDVTVTVERTVAGNIPRTTAEVKADNKAIMDVHPDDYETVPGYVTPTYEVAAVYGGGNLAPYEAAGKKAHVIINGCENTSIETVYGGGNAARVPETDVDVNGTYEIGAVFGGGNGKDMYKNDSGWQPNPGANVGTVEQRGNANTLIYGGTVHEAYGGSNELGTVYGDVVIDIADSGLKPGQTGYCALDVAQLVGAGKNADVNGDMKIVMGCKPSEKIPIVFGGADNANVNGDVELTVTSGNFGKIFGGNNNGGRIKGHIILNIEETTCIPLNIDHLYLCGNNAAYSQYGYYVKTTTTEGTPIGAPSETPVLSSVGKLQLVPRESANDPHLPVNTYSYSESGEATWTVYPITGDNKFEGYAPPVLNIISCTRIGKVFGGGYGTAATVYGNPTVNINMIPGAHASEISRNGQTGNANALGEIVDVYGGGDAAAVYGSTTVNIGTKTKESVYVFAQENGEYKVQYETDGVTPQTLESDVQGAYITGNVYGGGNEADVTGNTFVNICAKEETDGSYTSVAFGGSASGVTIGGDVFGGGKGKADTFKCEKAMVGTDGAGLNADYADGNTNVVIGNGTINGTVYGGGQIGRVERNTTVTIGIGEGTATGTLTSAPEIKGNVFGAGAGEEEHGYAALVRGNPTVTIQGNAKIGKSVYGGGEIASVARYMVAENETEAAEHGVEVGMPYVLQNNAYGHCVVTIGGYAEIGPDNMKMYHSEITDGTDKPDDYGHVFGAGRGVLPKVYTSYGEADNGPKRMVLAADKTTSIWEYFVDEEKYFEFIRTLALATETQVTIGDHAFVKGSVYGGSENGIVQYDTNVTIKDHCQIGQGKEITMRYEDYTGGDLFELTTPPVKSGSGSETVYYDLECASWDYGSDTNADGKKDLFAPYDPNANATGDLDKYPAVGTATAKSTEGGRRIATDGHTFYGNVFGGGSGSVPYFDTTKGVSRYIMSAGWVKGNTNVTISGGHILTNVYGGNEATNVDGTATITMTDGTIGVPRTLQQIVDHPVTCYLFGAGKGDQRVFFNKDTNVKDVVVNLTGGRIYGSVFGGGEDGHVLRNVTMTIGTAATAAVGQEGAEGYQPAVAASGPTIGTWGTSYVDGNVFGGGRGFGGDAYTAGNVAGSVKMEINGGAILGSVFGGGRLGSVGYGLFDATTNGQPTPGYGEMRADTDTETGFSTTGFFTKGRGHIDITISGGTIGNDWEFVNVPTDINESGLAAWKTTNHTETIEENSTTTTLYHHRLKHTKGGNVFAGGMGRLYQLDGLTPISSVDWWKLGCVKSTKLTITGGTIKSNVYGGGELGQVVGYHTAKNAANQDVNVGTEVNINSGTIGTKVVDGSNVVQYTFGSVFGGGYGSLEEIIEVQRGTTTITSYPKYIAGRVKAGTKVNMTAGRVWASVYGGGEMAAVGESKTLDETLTTGHSGDTYVSVSGGTVGIAPITISGSNRRYFGGAKMGNVYGGGSGHGNTVRSGHVYGNTNVTISAGSVSGEPNIYHNVYGGGAYGSVGDFTYQTGTDAQTGTQKVIGVEGLNTAHTNSGVATVTITGGTIGYDGKENGMVFGSSRGDINEPGKRDDHTAWVYDTHVTIGTAGTPASGSEEEGNYVAATPASGPDIKGSVYGSGENGHTFNNTVVTVNGGTIGISDSTDPGYTVTSNNTEYSGAAYPYRGNVYGGGCGTDMYYSGSIPTGHTYNDGEGDTYNPLAGIVYGTTTVNITGGHIVRNVYGAGAMGSVGKITKTTTDNTETISFGSNTGTTTIAISGGTIGVDGNDNGNVFGAARGDKATTEKDLALVKETGVTISGSADIKGSVYGGGETGDVHDDTSVTMSGGIVAHNVFGGGKGSSHNFTCDKAMVGVNDEGKDVSNPGDNEYKDKGTIVTISNGTIGTLGTNNQLAENTGNVYGGGEIGRVEWNTQVKIGIGEGEGTFAPIIYGNVYGAGKGLATHGYSALVRGNCTVTVQGGAKVGHNVYGGGENSTAGRYWVKRINNRVNGEVIEAARPEPEDLPDGMPYKQQSGGICSVTIQGEAEIGYNGAAADAGHVYGAGKGVKPSFTLGTTNRMVNNANGGSLVAFEDERDKVTNEVVKTAEELYLEFLQTLALATNSSVTIGESAQVKGSVFGGSESGFVQHDTNVTINNGTIGTDGTNASYGNVFGGGRGLEEFAEAGKVKGNTTVTINNGTMYGNVYGGGNLGDVGLITKPADYNYVWKQTDGTTANTSENNNITGTSNNTGICKVIITGGTIGISGVDSQEHGNVFGAGKGTGITWWCEKAR